MDLHPAVILGAVSRLTMALIFTAAAIHAMRDWAIYVAVVDQYQILPRSAGHIAARLLPPLSLVDAIILLTPSLPLTGPFLGVFLMIVFTVAVTINIHRGRVHIDCGCGGADGQRLSLGLIARNLVLMALLVVAAVAPAEAPLDASTALSIVGVAVVLFAFYFAANQLMTNQQALKAADLRRLPSPR